MFPVQSDKSIFFSLVLSLLLRGRVIKELGLGEKSCSRARQFRLCKLEIQKTNTFWGIVQQPA